MSRLHPTTFRLLYECSRGPGRESSAFPRALLEWRNAGEPDLPTYRAAPAHDFDGISSKAVCRWCGSMREQTLPDEDCGGPTAYAGLVSQDLYIPQSVGTVPIAGLSETYEPTEVIIGAVSSFDASARDATIRANGKGYIGGSDTGLGEEGEDEDGERELVLRLKRPGRFLDEHGRLTVAGLNAMSAAIDEAEAKRRK